MQRSNAHHPSELRGRDLICFSHDWGGDPLSKNHLMRLLARENRVLWVNSIGYRTPTASKADAARAIRKLKQAISPIRQVEPNLFVLSPLAIPSYGRAWIRGLNRWCLRAQVKRAMRRLGFKRAINWVFNPAAAIVAGTLGEEMVIYYCVDQYSAFTGVAAQSLVELESQLIARSRLVVTSSQRLYEAKRQLNPNTVLVRHGVDHQHFRTALDESTQIPDEIARLPRPIIGYFGLIGSDWVDIGLMEEVARRFPAASIVMLGKVAMDVSALSSLPNVHLLGRKPYEQLPAYCKGFDAAVIPFPINEATLNANPLKAREYLAAGLPVVSTAIPEVEVLGLCRIGVDRNSFVSQLEAALAQPGPSRLRSESVRGESWEARLRQVERELAGVMRPAHVAGTSSDNRKSSIANAA
ncbi:MAG: tuaH 2 [Phycisphaerales bacterium]|nr:tuaH 2 [Phycisphaerales bacterium]